MHTEPAGFGTYLWSATKATLIGGFTFLLPLVVILVVLAKAMAF